LGPVAELRFATNDPTQAAVIRCVGGMALGAGLVLLAAGIKRG